MFVSRMTGCSQTFLKICVYFNCVIVICVSVMCYHNQPCDVLGWTSWSPCSTAGEQSTKSIICCTGLPVERCLRICSLQMPPEMKERKRNCTPLITPNAHIVPLASTRFITSRSRTVRSFTENGTSSAFHSSSSILLTPQLKPGGRQPVSWYIIRFLSTVEKNMFWNVFQYLIFVY